MSDDLNKFIEIVDRLDKRWQKALLANNEIIRELAKEASQDISDLRDIAVLILDRLDKLNITQLNKKQTSQLHNRPVSELRQELLGHLDNIKDLEQETKDKYRGNAPWWITNQIILEKESIARLEKELKYVQAD